jgi:hypothetical protein
MAIVYHPRRGTGTTKIAAAGSRSFRRDPQPQAKGHAGHRADAAEPEDQEPQQALRQRSRMLPGWLQ